MIKSMAKIWFLSLILTLSCPAFAGQSYSSTNNGVGISVGTTGGLTFFHKIDEQSFVQAFLSRDLLVGADYAFVFPRAVYAIPELTPFIGGGAFVFTYNGWDRSRERAGIGARIPLGLMLQIPDAPVHLHLEIAPSCVVIPFVASFADVILGVRFLF